MNAQYSNRLQFLSLSVLLMVAGQAIGAASAWARTEAVRFTHATPQDVLRFEALVGDATGVYTETINLGKPTPDGQGVYVGSLVVADARSVFIAIRAVGASASSSPSNEQLRAGTGGSGGGTTVGSSFDNPGTPTTATAGALGRFDFAQATNWQDTGANFSIYPDDSLFTVAAVGGNSALTTQTGSSDIHSHYNSGSTSNYSNVKYSGRMAMDQAGAGVGVTTYSLFPTYNRYYALRALPGEAFKVLANPFGGLSCNTDSSGVVPQAGKWYDFELSVENLSDRNLISARVWQRGTTKPASPQVVCADTEGTRPTAGRIGVWSSGAGQKAWDELEVVSLTQAGGGGSAGTLLPPTLISIQPVAP